MMLDDINSRDRQEFVAALGGLFEGPPWIVDAAWERRPFASEAALHEALCDVMYAAARESQLTLLRAHPDLAGKLALAGQLSAASTREQAAAGLDSLTLEELEEFTRLNAAYRDKFAFPFVICARLSTKATIRAAFVERLTHAYDEEVRAALDEVSKICALRLHDLLVDGGEA
ncbi:MAG TPA: 2-oxo-4-hydroxy-4-carboxy-5-ureidoimidazoline decarboxylase [Ktedonobacterales bacterium]|nr:2-oxo-4-hydroxy-4-carboxy-5-ureidoimidazoline decarboxylase [Ktedonobacterales bacterium]